MKFQVFFTWCGDLHTSSAWSNYAILKYNSYYYNFFLFNIHHYRDHSTKLQTSWEENVDAVLWEILNDDGENIQLEIFHSSQLYIIYIAFISPYFARRRIMKKKERKTVLTQEGEMEYEKSAFCGWRRWCIFARKDWMNDEITKELKWMQKTMENCWLSCKKLICEKNPKLQSSQFDDFLTLCKSIVALSCWHGLGFCGVYVVPEYSKSLLWYFCKYNFLGRETICGGVEK